jgi:valyl-tRNA synthetase
MNSSFSGQRINVQIQHVEGYRHFCNKIFKATKLALSIFGRGFVPAPTPVVGDLFLHLVAQL